MTRAVFWKKNSNYIGFEISGHSGSAEAGRDIVCAAVSAMTMLVINTITEVYKQKAVLSHDGKKAVVSFKLKSEDSASVGLIKSFYAELSALEKEYPNNLKAVHISFE